MQEGEAIESRMVSRRISAAQKKVEERHFDSRKHLLEYDEVMDHQRKEVYGYRQRILEGANCKVLILGMFEKQIEMAVERFLDRDYGAAAFAEFVSNRLGVGFDASDFGKSTFTEAEKLARDKASRAVPAQVQEGLDENLGAEDAREWNWQALANQVNSRWGLKTSDRQLKQIGPDHLMEYLSSGANKAIDAIDLDEGQTFLEPDWGLRSLCDWARLKFGIKLTAEELEGQNGEQIQKLLMNRIEELYHQKEVEFPVLAGMAKFMSDQGPMMPGGQRYNREGLYRWAWERFPGARERIVEDDFRTLSRGKLAELLFDISRSSYPADGQERLDARLAETFEGSTRPCDAEDAGELANQVQSNLGLEVSAEQLRGLTPERVRDLLWTLFDLRYRPEMRQMERSLVLHQLDHSWKNHLYTMDHLRSGIGLVSYGQEDPKTAYKQQGMKEFRVMWEGIEDKVTETVFRMEESDAFQETLWVIGSTTKEAAPRVTAETAQGEQMSTNAGNEKKKKDPIRNRGQKVGRNDPCPCGSGKKYKNCHMT
jgi:preprotein translocase subunit SecA